MKPKDALILAASPLINAALTFITIPLLSWYLPASEVGKYSLILVCLGLAFAALNLGLDQAFAREYYESKNKKQLFRNCLFPGVLLGIGVYVVLLTGKVNLGALLIDSPGPQANVTLYVIIAANFFIQYALLVLRLSSQSVKYLLTSTLPKLLFLLAAMALLGTQPEPLNRVILWAYLLAYGITFVFTIGSNLGSARRSLASLRVQSNEVGRLFQFALPLYISTLFFWLISISDRIYIKALVDFDALGKYSLAMSIAGIATLLQAMFSTIWGPLVYQWVAQGINLKKYNELRKSILSLCVIAYCLVALLAPYILLIMPPSYAEVSPLIAACFGAQIFFLLSEMNVIGVYIQKKTLFSLAATSVTLAVNIFLNYYLISAIGIAGAAIALNLSFLLLYLLRTWSSNYVWQRTRNPEGLLWVSGLSLLSVLQSWQGETQQTLFDILWLGVFIIGLVYFYTTFQHIVRYLLERAKRRTAC